MSDNKADGTELVWESVPMNAKDGVNPNPKGGNTAYRAPVAGGWLYVVYLYGDRMMSFVPG